MSQGSTGDETRRRLLEAAAEVFVEYGYRHARIRDICTRAHANVSAVNYHFRDKEQLYLAMIDYAITQARPPIFYLDLDPSDPPEARLRLFIKTFIESIFATGRPAWYGKLVAKETVDPTSALDLVVEKLARPLVSILEKIVIELLGSNADPETIAICNTSIMSQCVIYHTSREIIQRMNPDREFDGPAIDRIAERITTFSLAGLRAIAAGQKNNADTDRTPPRGRVSQEDQ